jgi:hypothetical protein
VILSASGRAGADGAVGSLSRARARGDISISPGIERLGNYAGFVSPIAAGGDDEAEKARRRRRFRALRYSLLRAHWELACSKNQRKCRRTRTQDEVQVCLREEGQAHFDGVVRCGSATACPVCACMVAHRRSEELSQAFREGLSRGWWYCMVTVTLRHREGQSLKHLVRALSDAWRCCRQGKAWAGGKYSEGWAERIGYCGMVRALEATHGPAGWHPHFHVGLFLERKLSEEEQEEFVRYLFGRYASRLQERWGLDRPEEFVAIRIDSDDNNRDPSWYVSKLGLAPELGSGATKEGREGHRTPWQILRDWQTAGGDRDRALWCEWVEAMRGHHSLRWSRGFRSELLPEAERSDEEIAQGEAGAEDELLRVLAEDWDRIASAPGALSALLDAAERGGPVAAAWQLGELLAGEIERAEQGSGDLGLAEIEREARAELEAMQRATLQWAKIQAIEQGNRLAAREAREDRAQGMVLPRLQSERLPPLTGERLRYIGATLRRRWEDEMFEMMLDSVDADSPLAAGILQSTGRV